MDATTQLLILRLERLIRYHDDPEWAKEKEEKAAEITDGNCSWLDVLLQEGRSAIEDAKKQNQ